MGTFFLTAGIPASSPALYRQVRFSAGDPAALLEFPDPALAISEAKPTPYRGRAGERRASTTLLILRDIENERAVRSATVDYVASPADFTPDGGLSGDRETATAQSAAEAFRRYGASSVTADRALPLIYTEMLRRASIEVLCDIERGIVERRRKADWEIEAVRASQHVTESVMASVCTLIGAAAADADGILLFEGEPLTSERVRAMIDRRLLDAGFSNPESSIVAGRKDGGDCHALGSGLLRRGETIIVDIFPRSRTSHYFGDCTRTVVNGAVDPVHERMHRAVRKAKRAAQRTIRAGVTGEEVHRAVIAALEADGFGYAAPGSDEAQNEIRLTHGTGHGLGLSCHEPPLLDFGGPELLPGDIVSVEPGLYSKKYGGIRIEDMVVVTPAGCENLGAPISESLVWP
ncbi:MAG: aminopeptidase P family protein [Thermoguttaceae bacterium]|nr:aminopeptidase P family protein [Thermoguttaceae bacterium]